MFRRNSSYFSTYRSNLPSWTCSKCGISVGGSKNSCCGVYRDGDNFHSSGDWICPICKFRVCIDKKYCNRCHVDIRGISSI